MGALGNLRHDSALMGAISSTKGKVAMPAVVPVSHRNEHLICCLYVKCFCWDQCATTQCIWLDIYCSLTSPPAVLLVFPKHSIQILTVTPCLPLLQRTKEDLWLQRLRNQLTAPLEEALKNS